MSSPKKLQNRRPQVKGETRRADSSRPKQSVNLDELRELIALLRENGLAEFELEREGFRVRLRREAVVSGHPFEVEPSTPPPTEKSVPATPVATSVAPVAGPVTPIHPGAQAESQAQEDQDLQIIPSPIVGTFYRAASPNAEPFVKIGSKVVSDTVVCIIEAMKLMNEIQAETSGEVAKIYVENGQPVEYGQPLFGIKR